MRIAIVGYGKMGQAIEKLAIANSIEISQIISSYQDLCEASFSQDEVAVEFTEPEKCIENLKVLFDKKAKIVCGTTGWYDQVGFVRKLVEKNDLSFIYGENFALGVHLFWKLIIESAKIFDHFPEYQVNLSEIHHKTKKDFPSGTAQKVAELLINNLSSKKDYVSVSENQVIKPTNDSTLVVSCVRKDGLIARHDVSFASDNDIIEINHISKGRNGYALGAIKCAEWLVHKKGFFTIEDYIKGLEID
jgi:4-hydroxy-tetrahydrodipicolinate reductase